MSTKAEIIAEANRIKARLRECQTAGDIEQVATAERASVIALHKEKGLPKTMAIQILNLKIYLLARMRGFNRPR